MSPLPSGLVPRASLALLLVGAVALALATHRPPAALGPDAPPDVFSAARARQHLTWIAQAPRPVGSTRLIEVRRELISLLAAMRVPAEVQTAEVLRPQGSAGTVLAATVHNIIAHLPGTEGRQAVLVSGHYDSVPSGPGAGDDGSAVASMLEALRALRTGPPLKQDVIFLFTDAEEAGLLGAEGFRQHPLFSKVALALNFEARGTRGPSLLFETTGPQGWLIQRFQETAPHPMGNSLAGEVYPYLGADTDLSIFGRAGVAGMNFAFIEGLIHYHTWLDSPEQLADGSLQHHGENLLTLTRALAAGDAPPREAPARVYFNPVGAWLVSYPRAWALPLCILLLIVEVLGTVGSARAGRLRLGALALAVAGTVLGALAAAVLVTLAWNVTQHATDLDAFAQGDSHSPVPFQAGLLALVFVPFALVRRWGQHHLQDEAWGHGARLSWAVLAVVITVLCPGASYLFAWPLLLALLTQHALRRVGKNPWGVGLVLALGGTPLLVLSTSTLYPLAAALGLSLAGVALLLATLILGLLHPALSWIVQGRWNAVAMGAAAVGAVLLLSGAVAAGPRADRPWPESIAYWLDRDGNRAFWLSDEATHGAWAAQFLGDAPPAKRFDEAMPWLETDVLYHEAALLPLPSARTRLVEVGHEGEVRTIALQVDSPPATAVLRFNLPPLEFLEIRVGHSPLPASVLAAGRSEGIRIDYWQPPPEGLPLLLKVRGEAPVRMRSSTISLNVPTLSDSQRRPPSLMAAPFGFGFSDVTVITQTEAL
ncbi:M20/M25/M40 family metallo-hydrolase [Stigmatella sp. ncwal1]|uniref:M20/M25/M40 family metallo-hydrolase n=1 Tax=Stigmatella ashevillensis TaxID=2995309 RepID=A0ABT5D3P0_9BACT|nr:M20/M25/M40 family metallo-hydrolase [Stigmatella ashevillena]MDC0708186.1 M20/M25/M40 family metallo-hydrolase [Stigmatella ashevillena]